MTGLTQLTASGIRYLMTMKKIIDAGDVPRCIDISKEIQCTKPSIHRMTNSLIEKGVIECESRSVPALTASGKKTELLYSHFANILFDILPKTFKEFPNVNDAIYAFLAEIPINDLANAAKATTVYSED